ncbi:hypothetical protein JQC72_06305 [Polycladomyces sp. WAk]|uniref:Uncharacterized protein n=1 Tax=Polycladomyces zharkentensis TaxID=2807616 RepID=A0ABS2WIA2_9BACL|nr:hypothetical protein [Polycladomyces sp. WAk]MBN2909134.1 hypothetical protein [Polycladomyces sp. WAk]
MARRRMVDPNFWESEDVAALTHRQRLLLIGLFSNADDHGRGRAHPSYVRSKVFPYDDITLREIQQDLDCIAQRINIRFYTVNESRYYAFMNWDKWQTVQKPQPSKIPEPPTEVVQEIKQDETEGVPEPEPFENHSGTSLEQVENDSGMGQESFRNDSLLKEKKGKEVVVVNAAATDGDDWFENDYSPEQQEDIKRVSDHWRKKRAILHISPDDLTAIEDLVVREKVPADEIIQGIDRIFDEFAKRKKYRGQKINTFRYCVPAILEGFDRKQAGANVRPFRNAYPEPARPNVIDEGAVAKYRAILDKQKKQRA